MYFFEKRVEKSREGLWENPGKNAVVDDVGGGGEKWGLPIHQYGNQLPTVLLSGHTKFNATKNLLKIDFWNPSFYLYL